MAQFDVRRNPSRRTARDIPHLVEVQSNSLRPPRRRVVVPLVPAAALAFQGHGATDVDRVVERVAELLADLGRARRDPPGGLDVEGVAVAPDL